MRPYRDYHSSSAGDFVGEILAHIDEGQTVILDLGNATDELRRYFADMLSSKIFSHQEQKFTSDTLGEHFVQLYFEEAHNLFPKDGKDFTGVYARFAKEGARIPYRHRFFYSIPLYDQPRSYYGKNREFLHWPPFFTR